MTSYVTIHQVPEVQLDYLITAFSGWPDAAEGASTTVKLLGQTLQAKKFAEIDPEEFYDFTHTRPYTSLTRDGRPQVHWPANEFLYCVTQSPAKGVMLLLGVEPNLRWRTFSEAIAELAQQCGVKTVINMGALLDGVPHTREARVTGSATRADLQQALEAASVQPSDYQGPTGITAAVMEACAKLGMGHISLWGHTSHYLQTSPNYRVSYTLAQSLVSLLDLPLDLTELYSAAAFFDQEVVRAIANDQQLSAYVRNLEDQYDDSVAASGLPDPADVVRELEQFLKSEQKRSQGGHQS